MFGKGTASQNLGFDDDETEALSWKLSSSPALNTTLPLYSGTTFSTNSDEFEGLYAAPVTRLQPGSARRLNAVPAPHGMVGLTVKAVSESENEELGPQEPSVGGSVRATASTPYRSGLDTLTDDSVLKELGRYYEEHLPALRSQMHTSGGPHWSIRVLGWLLFFGLGLGPQLVQNALFTETAVLVDHVPEKESIAATLVTSFMVSNVVIPVYLLIQAALRRHTETIDRIALVVVLFVNACLAVLTAVLWDQRVNIKGEHHSVALIAVSFFAGAAGNTSTLAYFAYASQFEALMTTALASGYGASSLLAVFFLLLPDTGSIEVDVMLYFLLLLPVLLVSFVCFLILHYSRVGLALRTPAYSKSLQPFLTLPGKRWSVRGLLALSWTLVPLCIHMLWISFMMMFIPGELAYFTQNQYRLSLLNSLFMVGPPLGAAFAGVYVFPLTSLLNVVSTVLFVVLLLPVVSFTRGHVPVIDWVGYVVMGLAVVLSGYITSSLYVLFRRQNSVVTPENGSRIAAVLNQLGGILGILFLDLMILLNLIDKM